jgi:D-sedoheptulose 7-phosphate isomerase
VSATTLEQTVRQRFRDHAVAAERLIESDAAAAVAEVAGAIVNAYREGHKLLLFGNGGSAADAAHTAAELVGRYARERAALPAIALGENVSSVTAISNDYAFERVFARQVEALGTPGDVAIGISTSGASANVVAGLEAARAEGLVTVGLTSGDGGAIVGACDHCISIPPGETPRVQESHILVLHVLCELVEQELFP